MLDLRAGMVDIIRDFLVVHRMLSRIVERYEAGDLSFQEVQELVGDDDASILFRLKERCHAIFRLERSGDRLAMRGGALFDLAIGSLFHEAMKLRENLYQHESYAPRIEAVKHDADAGAQALLQEFEKILATSVVRLEEAISEAQALLAQTRQQLVRLMADQRGNALIARCLLAHRELVDEAYPEGLDALLQQVYGDPVTGYVMSAESHLESAYFAEAIPALAEALRRAPGRDDVRGSLHYAEGMQAFLSRDYQRCVLRLREWLQSGPTSDERGRVELAFGALSHVRNLVEGEGAREIAKQATELAGRLEALSSG